MADLLDITWQEMIKDLPKPAKPITLVQNESKQHFDEEQVKTDTVSDLLDLSVVDHKDTASSVDEPVPKPRKKKASKKISTVNVDLNTKEAEGEHESKGGGFGDVGVTSSRSFIHEQKGTAYSTGILKPDLGDMGQSILLDINPISETKAEDSQSRNREISASKLSESTETDIYATVNKNRNEKTKTSDTPTKSTKSQDADLPTTHPSLDEKINALKSQLAESNFLLSTAKINSQPVPNTTPKTDRSVRLKEKSIPTKKQHEQSPDVSGPLILNTFETKLGDFPNHKREPQSNIPDEIQLLTPMPSFPQHSMGGPPELRSAKEAHTLSSLSPSNINTSRQLPKTPTSEYENQDWSLISKSKHQTMASSESLPVKVFTLNGALDIHIHVADIRKVSVDAIVALRKDTYRIGIFHEQSDHTPYRCIIHVVPPGGGDELNIYEQSHLQHVTTCYDEIWKYAMGINTRSIAVPPLKGSEQLSTQEVASGLCKSLLNLATLTVSTPIRDVHIIDTQTDVTSMIIQMFLEGAKSSSKVRIVEKLDGSDSSSATENDQAVTGHSIEQEYSNVASACYNPEYSGFDPFGVVPENTRMSINQGNEFQGTQLHNSSMDRPVDQLKTQTNQWDDHIYESSDMVSPDHKSEEEPLPEYANTTEPTYTNTNRDVDEYDYVDTDTVKHGAQSGEQEMYEDMESVTTQMYEYMETESTRPAAGSDSPQDTYQSVDDLLIPLQASPPYTPKGRRDQRDDLKRNRRGGKLPVGFVSTTGCRIIIHTHDITKMKVDAVVTSARSDLQPGGKLSRAIQKAAGQELTTYLNDIIAEGGLIQTTDVVETFGCKLPCKHVLHAVCPHWPPQANHAQRQECLDDLQKMLRKILENASNIGASSVAIPLLGTGSRGIPPEQLARILTKTIITKALEHDPSPKEYHIVNTFPDILHHVVAAFQDPTDQLHLVSMASNTVQNGIKYVCTDATKVRKNLAPPTAPPNSISSSFEPRTFRVGNSSTVVIHVADISKLAVDAIVSPDTNQLEHNKGVAKDISEAAGPEMVTYLQEIIENRLSVAATEVVETPPGKLSCKIVFHVVAPTWPSNDDHMDTAFCLLQLKKTFDNIFEEAKQTGVVHVAMPPVGATQGMNNIPIVHVAEKLYRALVDNESRQQVSAGSLREIHIVDSVPDVLNILIHLLENGYKEEMTTNVKIVGADAETQQRIDRARFPPQAISGHQPREMERHEDHVARYTAEPVRQSGQHVPMTGMPQQQLGWQNRGSAPMPQNQFSQQPQHGQGQLNIITSPSRCLYLTGPVGYLICDHNLQTDVKILLYVGNITKIRVDAIVNPTDRRLKHHHGISQIIATAAGSKMKDEGQRLIKTAKMPVTGVVNTGSGNLPCNVVLHTAPPKWPAPFEQYGQMMENVADVTKCLQNHTVTLRNIFSKVTELGTVKTVALPVVRSEKAPIPSHHLAENVFRFLMSDQSTRLLREIHFVHQNQNVLAFLNGKLDAACRVRTPNIQVSPMGSDIGEVLERVMMSASMGDDTDLYAEIPAASDMAQGDKTKRKTKIGKITGRLTKLVPGKKSKDSAEVPPQLPDRPAAWGTQQPPDRPTNSASHDSTPPELPSRQSSYASQ